MGQNLEAAEKAYAAFLRALGLDDTTINISESASNTAHLMALWMSGVGTQAPRLSLMPAPDREIVTLKELPFYSFCGHHFVPFFGTIQIDYIPEKWIAGLGGFIRVIDHFSHRPQFQENLCAQIAEHLYQDLQPTAIRVKICARQMCLELHGKGMGIQIETVKICGDAGQFAMSNLQ